MCKCVFETVNFRIEFSCIILEVQFFLEQMAVRQPLHQGSREIMTLQVVTENLGGYGKMSSTGSKPAQMGADSTRPQDSNG
jgi:hypothetical protein